LSGLALNTVQDLTQISDVLAKSGFFEDSKTAAQCFVKVLAGKELGIDTFASMTGIHIIKGKPTIGANLMAAAVKASPKYDYRVKVLTPEVCEIEFFEGGNSLGTEKFTIADAKVAGTLNIGKFPKNMLFARAISNGVRFFCPDLFFGAAVYTPEELEQVDVQCAEDPPLILPESVPDRDWLSIISRLGWTTAKLKETATANGLPTSSKDLTAEQSDQLFDAVLFRIGLESNVFKAAAHCQNSLNKLPVENLTDLERVDLWLAKIEEKKEPTPGLDQ
jgi:hypothetical protein